MRNSPKAVSETIAFPKLQGRNEIGGHTKTRILASDEKHSTTINNLEVLTMFLRAPTATRDFMRHNPEQSS